MNNNYDYEKFKDMSCKGFVDYLLSLESNELTLLAIGLGYLFSYNIDTNKQNSLGNFFELIGQTLLTISAQNMVLETYPTRIQLQEQINELRLEIERLKRFNF